VTHVAPANTSLAALILAETPAALPPGFAFIPMTPEQTGVARLGVVIATTPGKSGIIVLREMLDARVVLGAIADAASKVHEFVEIWVQDTAGLATAPPTYRENLSNRVLDDRWRSRAKAFEAVGSGGGVVIRTGWEDSHPEPMFVDLKKLVPLRAAEKSSGGPWALCEDDEFLRKKGKEPYSASLTRYLYAPMQGDRSPLVAVAGPDAPDAAGVVRDLGLPSDAAAVSLGGLMLALPLAPLSFEQYLDAIGGSAGGANDANHSIERLVRQRAASGGGGASAGGGGGWLGAASASPTRRLPEVLHLKLRLLAEAVAIVRASSLEGPLLNLTADSFRVHLAYPGTSSVGVGGSGLPAWWTARVTLSVPGEAARLPIPGSQTPYFVAGSNRLSVYSASTLGASTQGRGTLRIRRVVDASLGSSGGTPPASAGGETGVPFGTMFECTLTSQERLVVGANDLVWLRFSIDGLRIDTYALAESKSAVSGAELRLKTLPQELPSGSAERLTQAAGVPIPGAMFEILPLLSTPSDLYSLGVLAIRTLLVNDGTSLAVALDELMSLANACAGEKPPEGVPDPIQALAAVIGTVMARDKRYLESLGCQRLLSDKTDPAIAAALIPARLWHETLATILRMFPAVGWFSRCKDFGDAPPGAPHRVYDPIQDHLHALLTKTRSLLVADHAMNREVHEVMRELLVRV
jgi:hypothetical protein